MAKTHPIATPYVVKPNGQGSSKSVYIIRDEEPKQRAAIAADVEMGETLLSKAIFPGRELTVAVKDGEALCVTEIIPEMAGMTMKKNMARTPPNTFVPQICPICHRTLPRLGVKSP